MIIHPGSFITLAIAGTLLMSACLAAEVDFAGGAASLTERIANDELKFTVKAAPSTSGLLKEGFRWGGEDTEQPRTMIISIVVLSNADKLFVPLSAYCDLGDPHRLSLMRTGKGFNLTIVGGDAAGAYKAALLFEGGRLVRRRVSSGEFPKQAWEETRYSYNALNN